MSNKPGDEAKLDTFLFCVAIFIIWHLGPVVSIKGDKQEVTRAMGEDEGEIGWPVGAAALKTMGGHRHQRKINPTFKEIV